MKKIFFLILMVILSFNCYSQGQGITVTIIGGKITENIKYRIEKNTTELLRAINEAYTNGALKLQIDDKIISKLALESIYKEWEKERFYFPDNENKVTILNRNEFYQIRNIPIVLGDTEKLQVVFEYLPDGRINDFYIGLDYHQTVGLLDASSPKDLTRREIILFFLDHLKYAYINKDIEYIKKLYSDKALIIVGKVLEEKEINTDNFQRNFSEKEIEYQVLTKSEYIERLQSVFNSISYLNLEFLKIKVTKHRKHPDFYGITLKQIWDSSNYSDEGLLFLLVQFKNDEEPLIWVRTWQDSRILTETNEYGLHNFIIAEEGEVR